MRQLLWALMATPILAGCSWANPDAYPWNEGWRVAEVTASGTREGLQKKGSLDCRTDSKAGKYAQFIQARYKQHRKNSWVVVPAEDGPTLQPPAQVLVNVKNCALAAVRMPSKD